MRTGNTFSTYDPKNRGKWLFSNQAYCDWSRAKSGYGNAEQFMNRKLTNSSKICTERIRIFMENAVISPVFEHFFVFFVRNARPGVGCGGGALRRQGWAEVRL
jgi:hypothetical protein